MATDEFRRDIKGYVISGGPDIAVVPSFWSGSLKGCQNRDRRLDERVDLVGREHGRRVIRRDCGYPYSL